MTKTSKLLDGMQRLLDFLEYLNNNNIWFRLEQTVPDAIMVTLTLVGARVEVSFFVDHIEYSIFRGTEEILDDEVALREMLTDSHS